MTGFQAKSKRMALYVNRSHSLGIQLHSLALKRPRAKLFRSFAEIDLKQIVQLSDLAASKLHLVKSDIKAIEPQTTIINFAGETFFSLFSEQDVIYEAIYDKLINLGDRDNGSLI